MSVAEAPKRCESSATVSRRSVFSSRYAPICSASCLRLGVTVLRLGRLHGERAQKQQQLQDLDFEIALADGLRHGVELGKNVRHAL